MDDRAQWAGQRSEHVNMIRHDHPGAQVVPLAVEVPERAGDDRGYVIATQPTLAATPIELRFCSRPPDALVMTDLVLARARKPGDQAPPFRHDLIRDFLRE